MFVVPPANFVCRGVFLRGFGAAAVLGFIID